MGKIKGKNKPKKRLLLIIFYKELFTGFGMRKDNEK